MAKVYFVHEDYNGDCINDGISIRTKDYTVPLIGDYKGVEICRIDYIPSRSDSVQYAESLANKIIEMLDKSSNE